MVAGRPLPNTKPVKPSTMPRSDWTSDSSGESDGSEKDPFADQPTTKFNVPSPVLLSDAEDDASLSQYQKEMLRQQARRQSDDEEEEEEDDFEEEEMEKEKEEIPAKRNRPKMDDMYSEFMNMARKFTSLVEDTRKQELMSRKTARQSLEFDSPPRQPAKYRHPQFTPPRHAREKFRQRRMMMMMISNATLCAHRKLALLVFVCRKGGELLVLKTRRLQVLPKSISGLKSMHLLKWPKPDSLKICVRRPPMSADSNACM